MLEFVFRMFSLGDAALPARGMGALARQIADQMPVGTVRRGAPVAAVEGNSVRLDSGEQLHGRAVVVACQAPAAAELLGDEVATDGQGVTCLYFAAPRPPLDEPILVLNGEGNGPINNLCVPSQVAPTYAPSGQSLVSVTVLGLAGHEENSLAAEVREQLGEWFGGTVEHWRHLRSYRIPYALPTQYPPALSPVAKAVRRREGLFVCGDYLDTASIQGAMLSGRRAAEHIIGGAAT
jgi:phytoene dehydrogenase-like protein